MAQKQAITQADRDWATNMNDPIAYRNPINGAPVFQSQSTAYGNKKAGNAGGSLNNTSNLMKTKTNPIYSGATDSQKVAPSISSTGVNKPLTGASQYQYNPAMGNMMGYGSSTGKPVYGINGRIGSRGDHINAIGQAGLGIRR